ncbi:MAG: hypothetical protein KDD58_13045 [Bdellovibrionales bacterium]|nr:hypothetical protein [Bdellovibrionales bacterium]
MYKLQFVKNFPHLGMKLQAYKIVALQFVILLFSLPLLANDHLSQLKTSESIKTQEARESLKSMVESPELKYLEFLGEEYFKLERMHQRRDIRNWFKRIVKSIFQETNQRIEYNFRNLQDWTTTSGLRSLSALVIINEFNLSSVEKVNNEEQLEKLLWAAENDPDIRVKLTIIRNVKAFTSINNYQKRTQELAFQLLIELNEIEADLSETISKNETFLFLIRYLAKSKSKKLGQLKLIYPDQAQTISNAQKHHSRQSTPCDQPLSP